MEQTTLDSLLNELSIEPTSKIVPFLVGVTNQAKFINAISTRLL